MEPSRRRINENCVRLPTNTTPVPVPQLKRPLLERATTMRTLLATPQTQYHPKDRRYSAVQPNARTNRIPSVAESHPLRPIRNAPSILAACNRSLSTAEINQTINGDTKRALSMVQGNIDPSSFNDEFLVDIGGRKFRVLRGTMLSIQGSRLAQIASTTDCIRAGNLCDSYNATEREFYFDRSSSLGKAILEMHRSGHFHYKEDFCMERIRDEFQFWQISPRHLPRCCMDRFGPNVSARDLEPIPPAGAKIDEDDVALVHAPVGIVLTPFTTRADPFRKAVFGRLRKWLWLTLEDATSSSYAMGLMIVSIIFVFISVGTLIMGSTADFQYHDNSTGEMIVLKELEIIDDICIVWFTIEYVVRLVVTPERLYFIRSPMSVIDLLAISPFFVELVLRTIGVHNTDIRDVKRSFALVHFLKLLRVLRVLRILKVARYSRDMQSLGRTIKQSWHELLSIVIYIVTANIVFATMIYFIESDVDSRNGEKSPFSSIPASSWWCIITMTTVGYGDMIPSTAVGKMIASVASLTGITLIALPISTIIRKFDWEFYYSQSTEYPNKPKGPWSLSPYDRRTVMWGGVKPKRKWTEWMSKLKRGEAIAETET